MWGFTWKNKEKMDHVMRDQLCWNQKKKKEKITYESEVTLLVWRPKRDGIHREVFSKDRHRSGRQQHCREYSGELRKTSKERISKFALPSNRNIMVATRTICRRHLFFWLDDDLCNTVRQAQPSDERNKTSHHTQFRTSARVGPSGTFL